MSAKEADLAKNAGVTLAEISAAGKLIKRAQRARALPTHSAEERLVLAILAANFSQQQSVKAKKRRAPDVAKVERRRYFVNGGLRHILNQKYRDDWKSSKTRMKIIEWLDKLGIEASDTQVRRDINAALKLGPLPTS